MSAHRGVSVSACTHGVWKVQPCTLWSITNFMLYFTKGYYMVALCRQTYNVAYTASYPTLMVTMMTPSNVLCTIKIWLWSCWRLCCMLLFVQFLKWVLFHGSVWKQLKECPLLFLADLSTHGCSLWYYSYLLWQVVGSETLGLPYLSSGWCHVQKTGIVQNQWAEVRRSTVTLFSTNYQRNKISFYFT